VKILFLARHYTYFRNFEGAIRDLAARGHRLHLAVDREDGQAIVERLARECPGLSFGLTPRPPQTADSRLAAALRLGLDYLRYADPVYDGTPAIRARASERTPRLAVLLAARAGRVRAARWLGAVESQLARPAAIDAFLEAQAPDLVLFTPLIELGSPQLDYLRAARARGLRTALAVWSWDHLSSKALIRVRPDAVLVWNETQRREAIDMHGLPSDCVVVTGAQCFDQWFDRTPARDRAAFCRRAGLADARPFVLYVCSALFRGSPSEAEFVRRWIRRVRGSADPALRDVPILVRPHPQRMAEWDGIDLAREWHDVAVFGSSPIDPDSRNDYFDSLHHSAAVVGLNTSALIEAAIVDRPVYTILLPEFHDNQEGTLHFRYLLNVGDSFLHRARSFEDHVAELAAGVAGRPARRNDAFVRQFIRPEGPTVPATPRFVAAIEARLAAPAPRPVDEAAAARAWRPAAAALSRVMVTALGVRLLGDPRWAREMADRAASEAGRRRRYEVEQRTRRDEQRRRRRTKAVAAVKTAILRAGLAPRPRH